MFWYIFPNAGRWKTNIENVDMHRLSTQVRHKILLNSLFITKLSVFSWSQSENVRRAFPQYVLWCYPIPIPLPSFVDGVVAACSSLGLDGVCRGWRSQMDVAPWCWKWIGWDWVGSPGGVRENLRWVWRSTTETAAVLPSFGAWVRKKLSGLNPGPTSPFPVRIQV